MNELETIEEEEKKTLIETKCFTKDLTKQMVLENFKQYVLLVIILKVILLI